jgi:hypothetical protein
MLDLIHAAAAPSWAPRSRQSLDDRVRAAPFQAREARALLGVEARVPRRSASPAQCAVRGRARAARDQGLAPFVVVHRRVAKSALTAGRSSGVGEVPLRGPLLMGIPKGSHYLTSQRVRQPSRADLKAGVDEVRHVRVQASAGRVDDLPGNPVQRVVLLPIHAAQPRTGTSPPINLLT